jgi:hypothetical protein
LGYYTGLGSPLQDKPSSADAFLPRYVTKQPLWHLATLKKQIEGGFLRQLERRPARKGRTFVVAAKNPRKERWA